MPDLLPIVAPPCHVSSYNPSFNAPHSPQQSTIPTTNTISYQQCIVLVLLLSDWLVHHKTHLQADRKLEVFTKYYSSLTSVLPIKNITSHLISAGVISFEDEEVIQQMTRSLEGSSLVLRKKASSLKALFSYWKCAFCNHFSHCGFWYFLRLFVL